MTLAFIHLSNVLSFLPSMLMRKLSWLCFFMAKFTLSLWSRSSLSIHHSMDILASSLSWLLSVLGAVGSVGVPVSFIGGFLCTEGLAWVCLMIWLPYFYSLFPRKLYRVFVQVVLYIFHNHWQLRNFSFTQLPLRKFWFIIVIKIHPPSDWRDVILPCNLSPLSLIINDVDQTPGGVFIFCLIVNGVCHVSLLKLASENSSPTSVLLGVHFPAYFLTAPRPAYSLSRSGGWGKLSLSVSFQASFGMFWARKRPEGFCLPRASLSALTTVPSLRPCMETPWRLLFSLGKDYVTRKLPSGSPSPGEKELGFQNSSCPGPPSLFGCTQIGSSPKFIWLSFPFHH